MQQRTVNKHKSSRPNNSDNNNNSNNNNNNNNAHVYKVQRNHCFDESIT